MDCYVVVSQSMVSHDTAMKEFYLYGLDTKMYKLLISTILVAGRYT